MSSTPFIWSSITCATDPLSASTLAPKYIADTVIVTGVMCGYSDTAIRESENTPTSETMIADTHAVTGRRRNTRERLG